MPVKIFVFLARKPGLSPDEFRDYWENKHMPLIKSLAGPLFPTSHVRHYLVRDESRPHYYPPDAFDGFAEVDFEDEAALRKFEPVMQSKEILEDDERFTDRGKLKIVVVKESVSSE